MSEPLPAGGPHEVLVDSIVAQIEAQADPREACIELMSGLAGWLVADLGVKAGCSLLYQFADDIVELEKSNG